MLHIVGEYKKVEDRVSMFIELIISTEKVLAQK